jgi:hypothetical protein
MYILQESGLLRWNAGLVGVSFKISGNTDNAMSHFTIPESPTQLLWKPQIKHVYSTKDNNQKQLHCGENT